MYELKAGMQLKSKNDVELISKFLEQAHWIDTLITEAEKQAVEFILVQEHTIFATHRL